jgi:signal peptidase
MTRVVRWSRRLLDVALIALVAIVLGVVLYTSLAQKLGHTVIVIRGASMEPAVPLGSAVDVVPVVPDELQAGDIVTVRESNGVLVTHRVSRLVWLDDGLYVETKGDANATPDPVLLPASAISGRVDFIVPAAGYLIDMLGQPSGLIAILGLALTLLLAIWLLEDLEGDRSTVPQVRVVAEPEPWEDPNLDQLVTAYARRYLGSQ